MLPVQNVRLQSGEDIANIQAVGGAGDLGVAAHPHGAAMALSVQWRSTAVTEMVRRGSTPGLGQQGHGLGAQVGGLGHVVPSLHGDDPAVLVHPGLGVDDAALLDQVLRQISHQARRRWSGPRPPTGRIAV